MPSNNDHLIASLMPSISQYVVERQGLAYVCVDAKGAVEAVSSNIEGYGFGRLSVGDQIDEAVDFMVGLDLRTELELPLIASPSGVPITVCLVPQQSNSLILISDASRAASDKQQLQQQANDNELLVYQQNKLMVLLEHTQAELKQKNRQLKEASRLQTSFISGVSHEFRTPLTSIMGYADLLQSGLQERGSAPSEPSSDLESYVLAMQRSSRHLLSLVENLLDHGKLDAEELVIQPKACSLPEVFDDLRFMLRPLAQAKGVKLRVDVSDANVPRTVVLDDSRLRQCLINLVGNAVKFTDHGSVEVSVQWQDDWLSVNVTDTGPGIAAENLNKIMLPFWQGGDSAKAGTGLGLTITSRLLELMGGQLTIESTQGIGTTAHFKLPAPCVSVLPETLPTEMLRLDGLRLLLAEDDPDIAILLCHLLQESGAIVEHVSNGALAVETAMQQVFDLVLMDIQMPVLTGYQAIEKLNKLGYKTPIVVMSASNIDADRSTAAALNCAAYLLKPVNANDIASVIDQVLARQSVS